MHRVERNFLRPGWPWRLLWRITYPWAQLHLVTKPRAVAGPMMKPQLCLANPVAWPLVAPDPDPNAWLARRRWG